MSQPPDELALDMKSCRWSAQFAYCLTPSRISASSRTWAPCKALPGRARIFATWPGKTALREIRSALHRKDDVVGGDILLDAVGMALEVADIRRVMFLWNGVQGSAMHRQVVFARVQVATCAEKFKPFPAAPVSSASACKRAADIALQRRIDQLVLLARG